MENPGVVQGFYKHEVVSIDNSVIESLGIAGGKWVQEILPLRCLQVYIMLLKKMMVYRITKLEPVELDTVIDTNDYAPSGSR